MDNEPLRVRIYNILNNSFGKTNNPNTIHIVAKQITEYIEQTYFDPDKASLTLRLNDIELFLNKKFLFNQWLKDKNEETRD